MSGLGRLLVRSAFAGPRHGDALLNDLRHFLARRDQLEDASVNLPVAELLGAERIVTQVGDVEAVAEVVEHDATLATEDSDGSRLVQHLNVTPAYFLSPVPGRGLEAQILRWRARGEQDHARLLRTNAGLIGSPLIVGKQAVSHLVQTLSAGLSQACPS
jgi:hypothetical protein